MKMIEFNKIGVSVIAKTASIVAQFNGEGYIENLYLESLQYGCTLYIIIDDKVYTIKDGDTSSVKHPFVYNSKGMVTTTGSGSSYTSYATVIPIRTPSPSSTSLGRVYNVKGVSNSSDAELTRTINLFDKKNNSTVLPPINALNYTFSHPLEFKKNFKIMYMNTYTTNINIAFYVSAILND